MAGLQRLFKALVIIAWPFLVNQSSQAASNKEVAQEMVSLPVHVVDPDGKPVARATVAPWALRCSQGHGLWTPEGFGKSKPAKLSTDDAGNCEGSTRASRSRTNAC